MINMNSCFLTDIYLITGKMFPDVAGCHYSCHDKNVDFSLTLISGMLPKVMVDKDYTMTSMTLWTDDTIFFHKMTRKWDL